MKSIKEEVPYLELEKKRLEALYGYNFKSDYEKTGDFQHVVSMAAHIFKVPIALVNFVYEKVVTSKSSVGMDSGMDFIREETVCSQAIMRDKVTVFRDAKMEPCLVTNPFVHGEFGMQFYAAAPLRTKEGFNIGVLAIIDQKPRLFSIEDEQLLESLGAIVMEELEERKKQRDAIALSIHEPFLN